MYLSRTLRGALLAGAALNFTLAVQMKSPVLLALRPIEAPLVIVLGSVGIALAGWMTQLKRISRAEAVALAGLGIAAVLIVVGHELRLQHQRQLVLAAFDESRVLGRHFMVGFSEYDETADLAARGLIGGVYIGRKAASKRTAAELRWRISMLQEIRRKAGLPPLFIAADQEGGAVAHLSPPLERLPPLASLVSDARSEAVLEARARAYGHAQGKDLADLGVTLNFGPVVDLLYRDRHMGFDTHTQLAKRVIADDPTVVTAVARGYGEGLLSQGVRPTLKHFPGLARVAVDTHHLAGHVSAPVDELLSTDWQPFRNLANSGAAIMVGHVIVEGVDPNLPASQSVAVIDGLLRKTWGFSGLVVTDDLNMGPAFRRGIGKAAVAALGAGADLILVSYDPDQFYPAMATAINEVRKGSFAISALQASRRRLDLALQWQRTATKDVLIVE